MAWFPNIPMANDDPSVSQGQLLQNFQALDVWAQVNHETIGSAVALNGMHKYLTFTPQPAPGPPLTGGTNINLFSGNMGGQHLWLQRSAGTLFPVTKRASGGATPFGGTGYCYLFNQFIMIWDTEQIPGGGTEIVSLNTGSNLTVAASETAVNNFWTIQITPLSSNFMHVSNINNSAGGANPYSFSVTGTPNDRFMWLVIANNAGANTTP